MSWPLSLSQSQCLWSGDGCWPWLKLSSGSTGTLHTLSQPGVANTALWPITPGHCNRMTNRRRAVRSNQPANFPRINIQGQASSGAGATADLWHEDTSQRQGTEAMSCSSQHKVWCQSILASPENSLDIHMTHINHTSQPGYAEVYILKLIFNPIF